MIFAFRIPTGLDWPRTCMRFMRAPEWEPEPYYWGA
jgi:hypothetical protein